MIVESEITLARVLIPKKMEKTPHSYRKHNVVFLLFVTYALSLSMTLILQHFFRLVNKISMIFQNFPLI